MIASPRLALLAACLYAPPRSGALRQGAELTVDASEGELGLAEGEEGRADFIPGAVNVPRATLPHAVSHRPAGHRQNYNSRAGRGGARLHMVAPQSGGSDSVPAFTKPSVQLRVPLVPVPQFSRPRGPALTMPVPIKATEVIGQWEELAAARARAGPAAEGDERTVLTEFLMGVTQKALGKMRRSIARGDSKFVFALVASEGLEDSPAAGVAGSVLAIATVSPQVFMNDFGMFAAAALTGEIVTLDDHDTSDIFEVFDVTAVVASPDPDREPGATKALIQQIVEWAAAADRLVTVSPPNEKLADYYRGLGFKTVPSYDPSMVYSGKRLGRLPEQFKMVTLAL